MRKLFDTHCHFDFPAFDADRELLLEQAKTKGVAKILIPGVTHDSWENQFALTQRHPELLPAYGLHPYFIEQHQSSDLQALENWVSRPECLAVGECGLDWGIEPRHQSRQIQFFDEQLALAKQLDKPLILHVRKAHPEVLHRLKARRLAAGGIVHAFSGSLSLAKDYIRQGFLLGIGGVITYSRAQKTRETVSQVPLNSLVLETDAPDMPLAGRQGQRNTPDQVTQVFNQLCRLRSESPEQIETQLWQNSNRLFGLA